MMMRPRDSHDLRLLDTSLAISPTASVRWLHDVFGNSVAIANFTEPAAELIVESSFHAEHFPLSETAVAIEEYARHYPFSYDASEIPDLVRTVERHYPDPDHRVDAWARRFVDEQQDHDTLAILTAHDGGDQLGVHLQPARRDGHPGAARHDGIRHRHLPRFRIVHDGGSTQPRLRRALRLRLSLRRGPARRRGRNQSVAVQPTPGRRFI